MLEKLKSENNRNKLDIEFFKKEPLPLDNVPAANLKKASFLSNIWNMVSPAVNVMSGSFLVTLFLNYAGVVDFQTILSKIGTERFNGVLLLFLGIYMTGKMLMDIIQPNEKNMEKRYINIWEPLRAAMLMSLFIPYSHGLSPFSTLLASMIHVWINTVH